MKFIIIFLSIYDLERIKNRDPVLFEQIYKDYKKNVFNFLIIKTKGNKELSEEIFQETFHNAIKYASSLKDENKILPWLLRIAKSKLIDYIRRQATRNNYLNKVNKDDIINDKDAVENIYKKEKKLLFKIAMENIKPKYAELLKLMYFEEKSRKEIAKIMNKSVSSIESLLYRAREALKKEISKHIKDFENE